MQAIVTIEIFYIYIITSLCLVNADATEFVELFRIIYQPAAGLPLNTSLHVCLKTQICKLQRAHNIFTASTPCSHVLTASMTLLRHARNCCSALWLAHCVYTDLIAFKVYLTYFYILSNTFL